MQNITLLGTYHGNINKCNPDELYKIIESLRPDDLLPFSVAG